MSPEDRDRLVDYRLERAHATLDEARFLAKGQYWHAVVNRLFYAAFQGVTAWLLVHDLEHKTHKGTRSALARLVHERGGLPRDVVRMYDLLFERRQGSDYDDFVDMSADRVEPLIEPTEELIAKIEEAIQQKRNAT